MSNIYGYSGNGNNVTLNTEQTITGLKTFDNDVVCNNSIQINNAEIYGLLSIENEVPICTATQPLSSDSTSKIPTTSWVQSAITENANIVTIANNQTITGVKTFNHIPLCTATQPSVADSSTKIPTTSWIQSAINAKVPTTNVFYYHNYMGVDTVQTYTVTPSSTFRSCYFIIAAGGGGGGVSNLSGGVKFGGGGGAGAVGQSKIYTFGNFNATNLGLSFVINVGGGGSRGDTNIANDPGKNGQNSSVTAYVEGNIYDTNTANGGQGGYSVSNIPIGGSGGACSTGTWCFTQTGEAGASNGTNNRGPSAVNKAIFLLSIGGQGGELGPPPEYSMVGEPGLIKMICDF